MIKKFIFFPIWKIDELENYLKEMEKQGYRLDYIKYSYWFYFKESNPKEMNYFLSYKSFRGQNMDHCDYAIESEHNGHIINHTYSYYRLYRSADESDNLKFLYEVRQDYILHKILENFFSILIFFLLFLVLIFLTKTLQEKIFNAIAVIICLIIMMYYLYGYIKQKQKVKKWEKDNLKKK